MDLLKRFNGDGATKEALQDFIIEVINEEAIKKMYLKEDVSHIADAKELIDSAFNKLEEMFSPKIHAEQQINQSK